MHSTLLTLSFYGIVTISSVSFARPAGPNQHAFHLSSGLKEERTESQILSILSEHGDPVKALLVLDPSCSKQVAEPRLLQIMNGLGLDEGEIRWMTEGDKLRLRREGLDFIDLTGRSGLVEGGHEAEPSEPYLLRNFSFPSKGGLAYMVITWLGDLPKLTHQLLVRKAFPQLSTTNMFEFLETFNVLGCILNLWRSVKVIKLCLILRLVEKPPQMR